MHTHGRAASAKNAAEERETSRRPENRALQTSSAAPLSAENVLALQRSIGNAAVSRLVPADPASAAAPVTAPVAVQRVKTEEQRGSHHRRIEMAETAARQLAAQVDSALVDHIFKGTPMGGAVDHNAPQGLHAYNGSKLPAEVEVVGSHAGAGNKDKVHIITWKYKTAKSGGTKRSTMFPQWMPREHVLALIALQHGANLQALPVNASNNVRTAETKPVSAHEIRTHILRGVEINLQVVGNTVYPTHSAF